MTSWRTTGNCVTRREGEPLTDFDETVGEEPVPLAPVLILGSSGHGEWQEVRGERRREEEEGSAVADAGPATREGASSPAAVDEAHVVHQHRESRVAKEERRQSS